MLCTVSRFPPIYACAYNCFAKNTWWNHSWVTLYCFFLHLIHDWILLCRANIKFFNEESSFENQFSLFGIHRGLWGLQSIKVRSTCFVTQLHNYPNLKKKKTDIDPWLFHKILFLTSQSFQKNEMFLELIEFSLTFHCVHVQKSIKSALLFFLPGKLVDFVVFSAE